MPNGQPNAASFNRSASASMGAGVSNQQILSVGITTPKRKYLNSIHISAVTPSSPAALADYLMKVAVCSSPGKLLNNPSILDFNPLNAINSDDLSGLGTIYFLQSVTLPYNNPIIFDTPILFTEGEPFYVICSIPYATGDSQLTPATKNVYLSVNGFYEQGDNLKYKMR